ncbi:MAG: hypothetical protein COA84_09580 [Robiginitomaculum sp.]|nr:MAG: hypothetical protein COA84_09580 [Robiginitomaculum sp.]
MDALEKLLLVQMQIGALPPERQTMLEMFMAQHSKNEIENARAMANLRHHQLILYGAIKPKS